MSVFAPDRKRNARGERRVTSLLDAAGRVFAERGYHAATTNAIAAEGKVSPATLYQFFPDKEAEKLSAKLSTCERAMNAACLASARADKHPGLTRDQLS